MSQGKTKHGQKLYGRCMRHKDVRLCAVGALSFYLAYRFSITQEFDGMRLLDWLVNSAWFDQKLLVEAFYPDRDYTKCMSNDDTYSKAVCQVLTKLGISSNHWVHLGQTLGPKILEFLEVEAEEIHRLGNWDPKIQEKSYSTKLPMKAIRAIAGFILANGMHYNPRTRVTVSETLCRCTPFGFAWDAEEFVTQRMHEGEESKFTAVQFLRCMQQLPVVLLQDAAAIISLYPDRREHPIFRLECFQNDEFQVSAVSCCFDFFASNLTFFVATTDSD